MNIATFTMKVRVLNVPDLSGLWACEWHCSRFPIPLQFLLREHLRLTVWIDDGTDFRWHLQSIHTWKIQKWKMINCSSPLPPLQSTPQMELGSILLGVQNREPKIKKRDSDWYCTQMSTIHLLGHINAVFISFGWALQVRHRLQDKEAIHRGDFAAFLVAFSPMISVSDWKLSMRLPGDNVGFMMAGGGGNGATSRCGRCKLLVGHRVRGRWTTACFWHF